MKPHTHFLRNFLLLSILVAAIPFLNSCSSTEKLTYFNNIQDQTFKGDIITGEPLIQKNDLLSITVSSLSVEASAMFNAPNLSAYNINTVTSLGNGSLAGYLVSPSGDIQFPILGSVKAEGRTKSELSEFITSQLNEKKLLVDPIVSVRFLNFRISVLGEVSRTRGFILFPTKN